MDKYAVVVQGEEADYGELDSNGEEMLVMYGGAHDMHIAVRITSKHNCGACYEDVYCKCGAEYHNAVNGCWQYGHQREESGDISLLVPIKRFEY